MTRRTFAFAGVLLFVSVGLLLVLLDGSHPASANPLAGVSDVAVGSDHSCALTTVGGVKCWGDNGSGRLGDGTTASSSVPVDVVGLTSGVDAIAIGVTHTCALTSTGGVKCWGGNFNGALGNGTTIDSSTPVDVVGLTSGVVAIGAGEHHSCAVITSGSVKCWGDNVYGQLGDGTFVNSLTPVAVAGISAAVAVESGFAHTCAVTAAGGLLCWGDNIYGQLGDGTHWSSGTPVGVSGLAAGAAVVAAGVDHGCALTTTGGVKCWGGNAFGQLGDGTTNPHKTPAAVSGLAAGVSAVAAGSFNSCAIDAAGAVQCWGTPYGATPVVVEGLESGMTGVAMKVSHTCAVTSSGGVKCWGSNGDGQLGDGTEISHPTPVNVVELTVKPTPTSTPCPGGICPTPTPVPLCPVEACVALAVIDVGGNTLCHSDLNAKCEIAIESSFTLAVDAVEVPDAGYRAVQSFIDFGNELIYKPTVVASGEFVWPDCSLALRSQFVLSVSHVCATGLIPPLPLSDYAGILLETAFTCSASESSSLVKLLPKGGPVAGPAGTAFALSNSEIVPNLGNLTINCVQPQPPVGGISLGDELAALPLASPDDSGGNYGVLTMSIAVPAAVALLAGIGWFATRRRLR